ELVTTDGQPVEDAERFIHTLILRGLSPRTRRTYAYDLLAAYRWMAEADRQPEQFTGDDLVAFIDYLQRPPSASPSTINRRLRLLQRFVQFLTGTAPVVDAWRQYAHALHFHSRSRRGSLRIKEPHRVVHPLKDAQMLEFYSSLRTWRDRAMVLLMWAEGLRAAEVLDLTVNDIDAAGQSLRIHGKGRKQRIMPLAEAVATTLRIYGQLERPTTSSQAVFIVLKGPRRGAPLSMDGLRRIFRYHRTKSGIAQANPHRFRHYPEFRIMPSRLCIGRRLLGILTFVRNSTRHNQRSFRKVRSESSGRKRFAFTSGSLVFSSIRCLAARSASTYTWTVSRFS
ncbi:MAG: hypothetical protein E4H28_05685, partial [Gemmatimonadales bacterium]